MAGQVKHRQIFSGIVPDLKLMGVLARLAFQNTDSLIGAVADALARDGITLLPSVAFLESELATAGAMTRRRPSRDERRDVDTASGSPVRSPRMDLGPDRGGQGPCRRGARGDGRHGRDDPARGPHRGRGHHGGEGREAAPGHALRRAVVGPGTLDAMARGGRPGARGRGRAHAC